MEKVLETLIKEWMGKHFNHSKLVKGSKHGFTKGRSFLTNLLELYEVVSDWVDEGCAADVVYLYFHKAFEKVPHRRLLTQVIHEGFWWCGWSVSQLDWKMA